MKKNILIYCTFALVLITMGYGFSACSKDDDGSSPYLEAFGPSPALRGGELRFLGKNLNKVTEVVLPDNISITEITRISNDEIKITVPQNAVTGFVVLKSSDGDITTKTKLTFSEPIVITKFHKTGTEDVTSVIAGDRITFTGDYMNLIREVVFTDNTVVSLNRTEDGKYGRDTLSVIVPLGAQSGKIALSNGAEMPILVYTDKDLTVAAAKVTSISPATVKAGKELTIKGEHLQLIEKVKFASNLEVAIPAKETPYAEVTELKVTVPLDAQYGKVTLVSYSGLEVEAGTITMTLPTVSKLSPSPVKGGTTMTIQGTNLDLVTNITFPNVEDAVALKTKSETEITVDVPLAAADGNLIFHTASTKTVEKAYTTVKSAITGITPTNLTAGENITIKGTNLDLVRSVSFGGGASATVTPTSATSFTVAVPTTATSGTITLHLINEVTVASTISLNVTPSTNPVISSMPEKARPGEEITLKGTNLNTVESVYFGSTKVTSYITRSATSITLIVPEKVTMGAQTVKMVNYEGKEFKSATTINITGQEPIVDPSLVWADFEDVSWTWGLWGGVGQFLKENGNTYYKGTSTGALSGTWLWANNNLVLPACPNITDYVVKADMKITKDFVPGNYAIQMAINGVWGWCDSGFFPMASDGVTASTGGGWITVTWSFSTLGISSAPAGGKTDTGMYINSSSFDWSNVSLDNFRYQKK